MGGDFKTFSLEYYADGLGFSADENMVLDGFRMHIRPNVQSPHSTPYKGRVICNGQVIDRSKLETIDAITSLLGPPDSDDERPEHDEPDIGRVPYMRFVMYGQRRTKWLISVDARGRTDLFFVSMRLNANSQPEDEGSDGC